MADLNVEKKENNDWWKWLIGIIALALILWLIFDNVGEDDEIETDDLTEEVDATVHVAPSLENEKEIYVARF